MTWREYNQKWPRRKGEIRPEYKEVWVPKPDLEVRRIKISLVEEKP